MDLRGIEVQGDVRGFPGAGALKRQTDGAGQFRLLSVQQRLGEGEILTLQ